MSLDNKLFDNLINTVGKSLDLRVKRENIISSNISNVDTPGYTPMDISFDEQLKELINKDNNQDVEVKATNEMHFGDELNIDDVNGELFFDPHSSPNNDRNTVDLDQEMSKLSMNSILYNAQVSVLNKQLALLKYAATDGGK
jgi:flagellar basal-body rod protein FlgB